MFRKNKNMAAALILNLLYPAVLGSIFYSVFSNLNSFRIGAVEIECALMMISVIIFFSIDYLYTCLHSRYNLFHLVSDCILLFLMQGAFNSINFLADHTQSKKYSLFMAGSFFIFIVWDYLQRKGWGKRFKKLFIFEILLFAVFSIFSLCQHPGYLLPAIVSIVTALLMVGFFLDFYSSKEATKNQEHQALASAPLSAIRSGLEAGFQQSGKSLVPEIASRGRKDRSVKQKRLKKKKPVMS